MNYRLRMENASKDLKHKIARMLQDNNSSRYSASKNNRIWSKFRFI